MMLQLRYFILMAVFGSLLFSSIAVAANVVVDLSTDKKVYYEGETIDLKVELHSNSGDLITIRGGDIYVISSDKGEYLDFLKGNSDVANSVFTDFAGGNNPSTIFKNGNGNVYGWLFSGQIQDEKPGELTAGKSYVGMVKVPVPMFDVGVKKQVDFLVYVAQSSITSEIYNMNGLDKEVVSFGTLVPLSITISDKCGNKVCDAVENMETKENCAADCTPCTSVADCPSGFSFCVNGFCTDGNKDAPCNSFADCLNDLKCVNGKCGGASGDNCAKVEDCKSGLLCVAGKCTGDVGDVCTVATDCKAGFFCVGGKCSEGKVGDGCIDGKDCASGFCVEQNGVKKCTSGDADAPCAVDGDCNSKKCVGGKCDKVQGCPDSDFTGKKYVKKYAVFDDLIVKGKSYTLNNPLFTFFGCLKGDIVVDAKNTVNADDLAELITSFQNYKGKDLMGRADVTQDGIMDANDLADFITEFQNNKLNS